MPLVYHILFAVAFLGIQHTARADSLQTAVRSPDGRNSIVLQSAGDDDEHVRFTVTRDDTPIIRPSLLGPVLGADRSLGRGRPDCRCAPRDSQ